MAQRNRVARKVDLDFTRYSSDKRMVLDFTSATEITQIAETVVEIKTLDSSTAILHELHLSELEQIGTIAAIEQQVFASVRRSKTRLG